MTLSKEADDSITESEQLKAQCLCDVPTCAKCLSSNCQDEDCPVHTKALKEAYRLRRQASERVQASRRKG